MSVTSVTDKSVLNYGGHLELIVCLDGSPLILIPTCYHHSFSHYRSVTLLTCRYVKCLLLRHYCLCVDRRNGRNLRATFPRQNPDKNFQTMANPLDIYNLVLVQDKKNWLFGQQLFMSCDDPY